MPQLSFLMMLLLCTRVLYGHVFVLAGGHGQIGLKGHMVIMEFGTRAIIGEEAKNYEDDQLTESVPRRDFEGLSIMYLGLMDKWNRLCTSRKDRADFIKLYAKILDVNCNTLYMWIKVLQIHHPEYGLKVNQDLDSQQKIEFFLVNYSTKLKHFMKILPRVLFKNKQR